MKRPSFQFYPADWQADLKLRRCSPAARGVWIDVLCAFHDSDDAYGLLRWPLKDIASTIGASMAHLRELVDKGVLRGSDEQLTEAFVYTPRTGRKNGAPVVLVPEQPGPVWYSKRLVKDEYVRGIRGEGTRFGEEGGASPKPAATRAPKPPFGVGTTSPSPSSPSVKENPLTPEGGSPDSDPPGIPPPPEPPVKPKRDRAVAIGLKAWLLEVKEKGEKPIPADDAVFAYADDVKLPQEFLTLAWQEFKRRYTDPNARRYKNWRQAFRNYVQGNYMRLWHLGENGVYTLTTAGQQAQLANKKAPT